MRGVWPRVGGAVLSVVAALSLGRTTAEASRDLLHPPLFGLNVLLTVSPDLPTIARRTLVSEAERIWRREHVALQWPVSPGGVVPTNAPLRVLVIARREVLAAGQEERWAVGELVPHDGNRVVAIASIAGAERVVSEAARNRLLDDPLLAAYRLGVVLGRAVAHEIGHYLLATGTHADRGLMRATIDAREFSDIRADTFRLDEAAGRWVRQRLLEGSAAGGVLPAAGFSYRQP